MTLRQNLLTLALCLASLACAACTGNVTVMAKPLPYTGVSLSGGEFYKPSETPNPVYGTNFVYPNAQEFDYFKSKGMNVFRVQFLWETVQPKPMEPLKAEEIARLKAVVKTATDRGLYVLIDPHNYARYYDKVVGSDIPVDYFTDFWSRMAGEFKGNKHVWFNLVNEPHDMPTELWLADANAAIAAIRKAGAHNLIAAPGSAWTGAGSWTANWYGKSNASVMDGLHDPEDYTVFDIHNYLDKDMSGTHTEVVSPTIGVERLTAITEWMRAHHRRAFLGEFGAADNPAAHQAVENMLSYMEQNRDVWIGWTWWAAGSRWGDYMYSLEPGPNSQDKPQMAWLEPHLAGKK